MENLFGLSNVFYEKNSDYQFVELNESLYLENIFENLQTLMGQEFNTCDFFIFSNHKLDRLPKSMHFKTAKRKVLLYLSDEFNKNVIYLGEHYYAIFKAYLEADKLGNNIFPLGIGYVRDVPEVNIIPANERKFNVFFSGNLNKNRIDFYRNFTSFKGLLPSQRILSSKGYIELLISLKSNFSNFFEDSIITFNSSFKSGFSAIEYGNILGNSKVVLSPKGFDRSECFRLYEAMRAGCVIISERLPQILFYKDSPVIQINNWKEGIRLTKQLLDDPKKLERLQMETLKWWEQRCSEKAMAAFIIRNLNVCEN